MSEKPQEIRREIDLWEKETGYSAEATYNTHPSETFKDMTEEQRERGVHLWKAYQDALEQEQSSN